MSWAVAPWGRYLAKYLRFLDASSSIPCRLIGCGLPFHLFCSLIKEKRKMRVGYDIALPILTSQELFKPRRVPMTFAVYIRFLGRKSKSKKERRKRKKGKNQELFSCFTKRTFFSSFLYHSKKSKVHTLLINHFRGV